MKSSKKLNTLIFVPLVAAIFTGCEERKIQPQPTIPTQPKETPDPKPNPVANPMVFRSNVTGAQSSPDSIPNARTNSSPSSVTVRGGFGSTGTASSSAAS